MKSKINKHIVQIVPYYPPHLGGMENCVKEISERLVRDGYKVDVLTSSIGSTSIEVKATGKLTVHYLPSIEIAHTPLSFAYIHKLFQIPKNSLLHIHIANAFFPEVSYVIAKLRNISYVVHFHIDVLPSGIMGYILPIYKKIILSQVVKNAQKVICLTQSQKNLIVHKYGIKKSIVEVVPNGINDDYLTISNKHDQKNRGRKTNLLYVGRLSKQKDIPTLIHAMSLLSDDFRLHVIGDGDQREAIQSLVQELNLSNVYLHGKKDTKELIYYYRSSDLFILPSNNEGMSLSLLEAMAVGLPMVVTDLPQNREFLGDGAYYVDNLTKETLSKAIIKLSSDDQKRKLMHSVNVKNSQDYSWDKIVRKIEIIYKDIR